MKQRLLKDEEDFLKWKRDYLCEGDTADTPKKYPCYASTFVSNWAYQEETAEYLYAEDIESLLNELNAIAL